MDRVPHEVARHGAAVMVVLFLGFLSAYVVLRAREKRSPGLARWTGPVSLAWLVTSLGALLLAGLTFLALRLHHHVHWRESWDDPGRETADRSWGMWLLQTSVALIPLIVVLCWIMLLREARRRGSPPGRHSLTALGGLLVSAGGLVVFWILYGSRLLK